MSPFSQKLFEIGCNPPARLRDSHPSRLGDLMTKQTLAPIIHTFKSAEASIMVNGYLIETSDHIVAVDSALIESAARELRKQFDSLGKPLAFVLITHGHRVHAYGSDAH